MVKMKAKEWKNKIKSACENVGTYREDFDATISTLADILETRDNAYSDFINSGANATIEFTNTKGETNLVKNPKLTIVMDLNTQALSYWRDLGLTPSGLKKMGESIKVEKKSSLTEILKELK